MYVLNSLGFNRLAMLETVIAGMIQSKQRQRQRQQSSVVLNGLRLFQVKSSAQGTLEGKVKAKAQSKGLSQLKVSSEVQGSDQGKVWLFLIPVKSKAQGTSEAKVKATQSLK